MWTVGIETSCREGSIALLLDDDLVAARTLSGDGRRHARSLVDELQCLLRDARVAPRDCDVIAVSSGPGSFTGLRVGVVCAKTWAFATGRTVIGVDTLLAVAEGVPDAIHDVDVIVDAQRGEIGVGRYRRGEGGFWQLEDGRRMVSAADWIRDLPPDRVVTGPAVDIYRDQLAQIVQVLPESLCRPAASAVARIGRRRVLRGERDDVWSLEPVYLRRSAAEERAEQQTTGP
ncbi:MAG: tRNA (adenosine(37)-N6)-threonylcarbamoyltransferase complex dimerization subunit type 1 TsaB [Planctomycetaceae bacterium]|nr:tRNA (adenosine(37)-N6)-threonylcarbamoyltransferase complex dimerization subunit type 1 TsaB [Planctomycetaceae bacterium]